MREWMRHSIYFECDNKFIDWPNEFGGHQAHPIKWVNEVCESKSDMVDA